MSISPPRYRVAIIGTGGIAHAHATALLELDARIELVAVADVDIDRATEFGARFGEATAYADAAELLESEQLDLVHICTPPQTHALLAILTMRAGVNALVEKPTALSLQEMNDLADVQKETGKLVLTVFQHRYGADAIRLRSLFESGVLGRALVASCETQWFRADDYFDVPWRGRWDVEGGGPTMGHGIHQFDLLLSVLGPWSTVSALAARQTRPTDTEDVSVAVAKFENGALATIINSVVSPRETSRLRFDFENATVEVEHLYGYVHADWRVTPAPGHEAITDLWNADGVDHPLSSHGGQFAAILDAFDAGAEPGVPLGDAYRTLELAAAIYASAFRGTPIAAGAIAGDDPFVRSMDGGEVPWAPVKAVAV